jgi:hypothetical protein
MPRKLEKKTVLSRELPNRPVSIEGFSLRIKELEALDKKRLSTWTESLDKFVFSKDVFLGSNGYCFDLEERPYRKA